MNKQDKEKENAKELAEVLYSISCNGHLSKQDLFHYLMEMAAWKEQQMIEKAILFLRRHNCTIAATIGTEKTKQFIVEIEDFKKYMEG